MLESPPTPDASAASPAPPKAITPPVIALRDVHKRFGTVAALNGLDLTVHAGQVYGFLGRNGAGKSTALRIIMGITQPTAGSRALFGTALRGDEPAERRRIGYVAQEQAFYGWMTPLGLGHFVSGFYPTWDDSEYRRLLARLDVPPDRKVQTFSGGTTAKLALAVALAHRPELLVLDEPTAGMDPVARREFLDLVRGEADRAGRTTLFSSHLIDEVELAADTVGIVDGGRMIWEGRLTDLRQQTRSLCLQQTGAAVVPLPALLTDLMVLGSAGLTILEDRTLGDRRTVIVHSRVPDLLRVLETDAAPFLVQVPPLEEVFVALVRRPGAV